MAHADDDGLIIPPKLAPTQVVIVPIFKNEEQLNAISEVVDQLVKKLRRKDITVQFDKRDTYKPGWKFAEYEQKGIPVRIAVGPRDLENGTVEVARRDTKEKQVHNIDGLEDKIKALLEDIQQNIYNRALQFRADKTTYVATYDEFKEVLDSKGGFLYAHWDGTAETEEKIKNETKATIRLIPFDNYEEGVCIYSGKSSRQRVVFARAY